MGAVPFLPPTRPRATRERIVELAGSRVGSAAVYLVGIRGYYHDFHSSNERAKFDDAIFLVSPDSFVAWNANTDPSIFRRGIAKLKTGVWQYKLGIHGLSKPKKQQYRALVQADVVTVTRDGIGDDTGMFGINLHRSGTGTSSLGCQTIWKDQWASFITLVEQEMKRRGQKVIPYVLTE